MRQEKRPKRRCGDCVHCNGDAYKMIRTYVCYEIGTSLGGGSRTPREVKTTSAQAELCGSFIAKPVEEEKLKEYLSKLLIPSRRAHNFYLK